MNVTVADQVAEVLAADACSGCGACCLLDSSLTMELDTGGFLRPRSMPGISSQPATPVFDRVCPGRSVRAQKPVGSSPHATMGPTVSAHQGWSTDPELRWRGSSGGVLSTLAAWLLGSGRVDVVTGAGQDPVKPTRTVTIQLRSRDEAAAAAGSRYGPVSNAAQAVLGRSSAAFIGKPCEVAAVRALAAETGQEPPLLLSFFCAGTPSQLATDSLAAELAGSAEIKAMWYRGRGWPGHFTVVTDEGRASVSYDESWGRKLGPAAQWRCKICVDGIGDSADLVAADYWHTDDRGYPLFEEGEGISAILARTARGQEVLEAAVAAGVLEVEPLAVEDLAAVQPFQVRRRVTLWGRLMGARLAGRAVPDYLGFGLWRHILAAPREQLRAARGTRSRIRKERP